MKVVIPALIAGAALIFPHIQKHHLKFNKYIVAATLGSFFFALELIITRLILDFYSPITFYFLRCSSIFLISLIVFRPKLLSIDKKASWMIFGTGFLWVIYRVIVYYGYIHLGVIFTTLMIMLSPIFIYAFAYIFLKERPSWKNLVSAGIIVACVLYVSLA